MGKPYESELRRLRDTYSWALAAPIEPLVTAVARSTMLPLLSVGSGGSFSSAHLACMLHQYYTGMVSRPVTPLDLVSSALDLRSASVMFISAGGSNSDIITAFKNAMSREPQRCSVLCLLNTSALARLASSYPSVAVLGLDSPSPKDGFLATNSLLAFSVLLVRAYCLAFLDKVDLPPNFDALLSGGDASGLTFDPMNLAHLWERETLVVLHGPSVSSAAIDLESKFSESALGNVQLSDFRNFAHGRHHWLARRADRTGILALYGKKEQLLAEKTLSLVPASVPITRVCLPHEGHVVSIAALVAVLQLVGSAGEYYGIDPGQPRVPMFGRRLYGLKTLRSVTRGNPAPRDIAIARKLRCDVQALGFKPNLAFWRDAYSRYLNSFKGVRFGAILFDYDGTLCDEQNRFTGIQEKVKAHLTRLVKEGILIGVATGRGKSVREDLRKALPQGTWQRIFLGYYNGADIASLAAQDHPDSLAEPSDFLKAVAGAISEHPLMPSIATWEIRRTQVSIQPISETVGDLTWRIAQELAQAKGLMAARSSHSVDLLLPNISKRSLHSYLRDQIPNGVNILAIGDKGELPGNDHDLLTVPYSLSVDEVSPSPNTCWNLAPAGFRGVQATLAYLDALQMFERTFTFDLGRMGTRSRRSRE